MARFLTQEWLDEFQSEAKNLASRPGATVKIQYRATEGPDGDIEYYWILEDGKLIEARLGACNDAALTLTMSYKNAAKLQRGELTGTSAFMQGKLKVTGAVAKMMALMPIQSSPEWKQLEEKFRVSTEF